MLVKNMLVRELHDIGFSFLHDFLFTGLDVFAACVEYLKFKSDVPVVLGICLRDVKEILCVTELTHVLFQ